MRLGFLRWYSRLYRNQGSLLFGPPRLDWGDQLVVITGGSSGIGELVANTLAVRNVTVVVLDVNPIVTENCELLIIVMKSCEYADVRQTISHTTSVTFPSGRRSNAWLSKS